MPGFFSLFSFLLRGLLGLGRFFGGGRWCPRSYRVTGLIVGLEALRLESHEEGAILGVRILEDQAAILEHTVVSRMTPVVALVHLDVVHAVPRQELEVSVLLVLWAEARAKGIDHGAFLINAGEHGIFHRILEIVLDARDIPGYDRELVDFDDAATDKVLR